MGAQHGRVPAARGEGPDAGDLVAALAFDRPDLGAGAPRQDGAGVLAKQRLRHRRVEIGRRHRAAAGLAHAPRGRSVGLGDGLDHMEEGNRIGLDAVGRARHQQPEQPRLVQLVEQRRRQPARLLDFVGRRCDSAAQSLCLRDHGRVAREADGRGSGRWDQRVQGGPLLRLNRRRPVRGRSVRATCPWSPARRNNRPPRP